jgi:membrane protease YdiL (CAAX protease family)
MDQAYVCSRLRREFNRMGYILLVYYGMMTAAVTVAMIIQLIWLMLTGQNLSEDAMMSTLMGNGWGYIVAVAMGCLALLLWKKPAFCFRTIWKQNRPMTVGTFFALLSIFLSAQLLFQLFAQLMEFLFNLIGMSVMDSINAASGVEDTFSMFVYACILAPVFEEVLFRGLLLRILEPYGKKFAVLATAFLFGIFHANIVQSPFAFMVGLVLGYVTVEHGMLWAVLLHFINNCVLGDLLSRLTSGCPLVGELIFWFIVVASSIAAVVVCIVKRKAIRAYLCEKKIHPWSVKSFFTAPGIVIFTVLMLGNIALTLLMQ